MKKLIISLLLLALLGGGGFVLYQRHETTITAAAAEPPYQTATVQKKDLRITVDTTGSVESNLDVNITCKASGTVIHVYKDISDTVKQGDLLLELDPVDENRVYAKAQAVVDASQAKVDQAKADLDLSTQLQDIDERQAAIDVDTAQANAADAHTRANRMQTLLKDSQVSQEDTDTAVLTDKLKQDALATARNNLAQVKAQRLNLDLKRQALALAKAQLRQDQVSLEIAAQSLKDIKVYAPIDGTVSDRAVQPGQIIASATSNVSGGTQLLTLSDLNHIFVVAAVDESDIGKVALNQKALITADAYPNMTFFGKVVQIATQGITTSNVVTFNVKIEVLSPNKQLLKPVMTTSVAIHAAEAKDALTIPSTAVLHHAGQTYVLLPPTTPPAPGAEPDYRQQDVTLGLDDGLSTQILTGLNEGDTVVLPAKTPGGQWAKRTGPSNAQVGGHMLMRIGGKK